MDRNAWDGSVEAVYCGMAGREVDGGSANSASQTQKGTSYSSLPSMNVSCSSVIRKTDVISLQISKATTTISGGFKPNCAKIPQLFSTARLLQHQAKQMTETRSGYSTFQISLHWMIAALVLFQLLFGESMTTVVDAAESKTALSPADQAMGSAHYWVGLSILALVIIRLVVRLASGAPKPAESGPTWMQLAARASHSLFYLLLLATPILGLLAFYVGDPWGDIHSLCKPVFIVLISMHALAAIFHQFWLRDGTLKRMLAPVKSG